MEKIFKVYSWLENHGEVFLRRNQSIGKNLMRAKMLHLSHENFVKVLKVYYISKDFVSIFNYSHEFFFNFKNRIR